MPSTSDVTSEPLLMTAPRAAERLGVPWITFRRLMDAGEINYVQWTVPNGTRWIEEDELLRLIERHRKNAQTAPSGQPATPCASQQRHGRQQAAPAA